MRASSAVGLVLGCPPFPHGGEVHALGDEVSLQIEGQFRSAYDRPAVLPSSHLVPWGVGLGLAALLVCLAVVGAVARRRGALAAVGATLVLAAIVAVAVVGEGLPWIPLRTPIGHREHHPEPYLTAPVPGMPVLHLAMIDDVLHQRYPRLGLAWDQHRVLKAIATERKAQRSKDPAQVLVGLDALEQEAASYDRAHVPGTGMGAMLRALHWLDSVDPLPASAATTASVEEPASAFDEHDRALLARVQQGLVLRQDLRAAYLDDLSAALQQREHRPLPPLRAQRVRALTTLSTLDLHQALELRRHGNHQEAMAALDEAHQRILQAIALDPGGASGTACWQAVLIAMLAEHLRHPERRWETDLLGESTAVPKSFGTVNPEVVVLQGEQPDREQLMAAIAKGAPEDADLLLRAWTRLPLVRVGDPQLLRTAGLARQTPVAIDQPLLALLDCWVVDGGPEAELALTIGILCERMGQLHLAWTAFERAAELAPTQLPAEDCVPFLALVHDHQQWIAHQLAQDVPAWEAHARQGHRAALEEGARLQAEYANVASTWVQDGHRPDDPGLEAQLAPLRARFPHPPGAEDEIVTWVPTWKDRLADGLVAAALIGLIGLAWVRRPAPRPPPPPAP